MPSEIWKPIAGFDGLYEVSDQGRVRSLDRIVSQKNRWGTVNQRRQSGCILSPGNVMGYFQVQLAKAGKITQRKVHQLVLEAFLGPRPKLHEGRHLDGVREHCALSNLCWGTKLENAKDKHLHGTMVRGAAVNTAILTADKVLAIRRERAEKRTTLKMLAAKHGTCLTNVGRIVRRETWNHL